LQVLTNFLANAIKFSPVGETIRVECAGIGNRCRFAVTDRGPGLPKAQIHKLFGRFEQLRSTDGKQRPGSGLGLAIAKAIVEQHGGQIGVEQPEDGGSTFWFSLPLALDEEDGNPVQLEADRARTEGPALSTAQVSPVSGASVVSPVANAAGKPRLTAAGNGASGKSTRNRKGKKSKRS
jgi:hypothetical protein